jgi:hypothetical protein
MLALLLGPAAARSLRGLASIAPACRPPHARLAGTLRVLRAPSLRLLTGDY